MAGFAALNPPYATALFRLETPSAQNVGRTGGERGNASLCPVRALKKSSPAKRAVDRAKRVEGWLAQPQADTYPQPARFRAHLLRLPVT